MGLDPYCVFMGWDPASDFPKVVGQGFDAVSAYAAGSRQPRFAQLAEYVQQSYWREAADARVPFVPLVTTGWDKRPRQDHPVSWEKDSSYHSQKVFPSTAQPAEIETHLRNAVTFVAAHPEICESRAIIIYAWNEYDEGGWIAPTWRADASPDRGRLNAIRRVLD